MLNKLFRVLGSWWEWYLCYLLCGVDWQSSLGSVGLVVTVFCTVSSYWNLRGAAMKTIHVAWPHNLVINLTKSFQVKESNWKIPFPCYSSGSAPIESQRSVKILKRLEMKWVSSVDLEIGGAIDTAKEKPDPGLIYSWWSGGWVESVWLIVDSGVWGLSSCSRASFTFSSAAWLAPSSWAKACCLCYIWYLSE